MLAGIAIGRPTRFGAATLRSGRGHDARSPDLRSGGSRRRRRPVGPLDRERPAPWVRNDPTGLRPGGGGAGRPDRPARGGRHRGHRSVHPGPSRSSRCGGRAGAAGSDVRDDQRGARHDLRRDVRRRERQRHRGQLRKRCGVVLLAGRPDRPDRGDHPIDAASRGGADLAGTRDRTYRPRLSDRGLPGLPG